jgi:transposase
MAKRKRRKFTEEFKADAVKLVRAGGRSLSQVAADLDLTETSLRGWVRRAKIEVGEGPPGALTQAEREELVRLRRENKRLQMERDILKNLRGARHHPVGPETRRSLFCLRTEGSGRELFGDSTP